MQVVTDYMTQSMYSPVGVCRLTHILESAGYIFCRRPSTTNLTRVRLSSMPANALLGSQVIGSVF